VKISMNFALNAYVHLMENNLAKKFWKKILGLGLVGKDIFFTDKNKISNLFLVKQYVYNNF